MKVYSYHSTTMEYVGVETADLDPLETEKQGTDVYLIPAHSTTMPPPPTGLNEVAVYVPVLSGWVVEEDFRGEVVYDKNTMAPSEVIDIGPIPFDKTRLVPTSDYESWDSEAETWVRDTEAEEREANKRALDVLERQLPTSLERVLDALKGQGILQTTDLDSDLQQLLQDKANLRDALSLPSRARGVS